MKYRLVRPRAASPRAAAGRIPEDIPVIMDRICLALAIIGALNWGSIGIFKFDVVAWICGGQTAAVSRIIYTLVALAGLWCVSLFFRDRPVPEEA